MSIVGIDQIDFAVEDLVEAEKYLLQWGLVRTDERRYECWDGSAVTCVSVGDVENELRPHPSLRRVIWGVSDGASLHALAERLATRHATAWEGDHTCWISDPSGLPIGLRVTHKRPLNTSPTLFNTPGVPSRIDARAVIYERATPLEISHVVLGVADLRAAESFYCDDLGFRISDRYVNRGIFLRAHTHGHHHNLFLLDDGKFTFNHVAFKVRDLHEVIGGGQALLKTGFQSHMGPGRHYLSSGCFWYFRSPFGGAMEYVADEDELTDAWIPSERVATPSGFSEWTFHTGPQLGALAKQERGQGADDADSHA